MSIRKRLLLSYIAMTIVPVILFALIAGAVAYLFMWDYSASSGGGKSKSAIWQTFSERDELAAGVKFMARVDPDRFADNSFLTKTDEQLNGSQSGLIVMKNNKTTFFSPFLSRSNFKLSDARTERHYGRWSFGNRYKSNQIDFTFSDGSTGSAYVIFDFKLLSDKASKYFPILVLSLLVVVGLTNGILTFLVSRSLIKPLYALKHATEQIKEGRLDHPVELKRKDEIGELGAAFEEMRSRLQESIHLQLQYEENRKDLVSSISHDLKTPITGIKVCLEGIRDGIADTEQKREKYMNMIATKTEEMDRLIDELMLFSKLDLKRLPFQLEPVDLTAYLRDCVEQLQVDPQMDGTDVTLSINDDRPVTVIADREKLRRVIMNIVDNSLKYMEKNPKEIHITLSENNDEATVHIKDNGPGIESAALPHIFDRFYRADPSRNSSTGGSGIGLAIVKQIVEGQGGKVWAESVLGEGTGIYFTLPKTKSGGERL